MDTRVYKDECVYTFDNQDSECGVDVCLKCFRGTSSGVKNFTKRHARVSNHTAFLNLKRVPKPNFQSKPVEHTPKKLSIEAANDSDKFITESRFKTLAGDSEDDFKESIIHVLAAESYNKIKQNEAWELELESCEHVGYHSSLFCGNNSNVSNSTQSTRLSKEQLSKCTDCDLNKNLWLCLECGNLGCGRTQFDGSGGNSHALSHYESTKHPLAVKLGTITPEGHVDLFCYACNEDRIDPDIVDHLSYWGIDLKTQIKTEKSMTELQIEQNISWDFTTSDSGEPVDLTGMVNLGNTCYLNSVMQSLFRIPEFRSEFQLLDPDSSFEEQPDTLETQLRKMRDGLLSGRYKSIAPMMFKYLIGLNNDEFSTMKQQDAFEFYTHLVGAVQEKVSNDPASKLFGFQTERRLACSNCDAVKYIVEDQLSLSIQVPIVELDEDKYKEVEFKTLIELFTAEEEIESKCSACGHLNAKSKVLFKTVPQILVVNVRRFLIENWVPRKVDVPVVNALNVDLNDFKSLGPQPNENVITDDDANAAGDTFNVDPEQLSIIECMGFPAWQATAALILVSNEGRAGDLELALNHIFMGDVTEPVSVSSASNEQQVTLESLGFSSEQAAAALKTNGNNVELAAEWLFAGKYVDKSKNVVMGSKDGGVYGLNAIVCHKGPSVQTGHYVAAVLEGDDFVLFNDERVTKSNEIDELQKYAYIYMFTLK